MLATMNPFKEDNMENLIKALCAARAEFESIKKEKFQSLKGFGGF